MSFPASSGILTPQELQTLSVIFAQIASEPWFTRSEKRQQQFALVLLNTFRKGTTNPVELAAHCRQIAALEFGNASMLH